MLDAAMNDQSGNFEQLMKQVEEGSEDAFRLLLDEYGEHILRAVRRRLSPRYRSKYDSQDFVQSVWACFFDKRSQIVKFDGPESLIAYLTSLARNKVADRTNRHFLTQKRDVTLEKPIGKLSGLRIHSLRARQPTPSETVMAKEEREKWDALRNAKPEHYQKIVDLRAAGHTINQIAAAVEMHERTVRRILDKLVEEVSAKEQSPAN